MMIKLFDGVFTTNITLLRGEDRIGIHYSLLIGIFSREKCVLFFPLDRLIRLSKLFITKEETEQEGDVNKNNRRW